MPYFQDFDIRHNTTFFATVDDIGYCLRIITFLHNYHDLSIYIFRAIAKNNTTKVQILGTLYLFMLPNDGRRYYARKIKSLPNHFPKSRPFYPTIERNKPKKKVYDIKKIDIPIMTLCKNENLSLARMF